MDQNLQAINIVSAKQYVTRVLWKKNYHSSLLSGDWNAKHTAWGAQLVTPKGRNLFQALSSYNYHYFSTGGPTYWPTDLNKLPDLLDFLVARVYQQITFRLSPPLSYLLTTPPLSRQ